MKEKFILLVRLIGILMGIAFFLTAIGNITTTIEPNDWLLLIVIPFELILGVALILPYFQIKNYRIRAINFTLGLGSGILVSILLILWFILAVGPELNRLLAEKGQTQQILMVCGIFILLVILMLANFFIIYKQDIKQS